MRVVERVVVAVVGQELAKVAVVVVAHRLVERERLPRHLDDAAGVFERQAGPAGGLFGASARGPAPAAATRLTARTLLIVSIMCTGTRIVRLWSAMARVIAWRIHQVA